MTKHQISPRKAAAARRYPARVIPPAAVWRRRVWIAVGPLMNARQRARRTQLEALTPPTGAIVFLGDSITEEGVWNEWFPSLSTANRGVGGETTAQILDRVDGVIASPRAVLLLAGTNDIASGVATAQIVSNIAGIIHRIESLAPGTPIVIQSIMPRTATFRDEILYVNALLKELVESVADSVTYLDLWPALATTDGNLRLELTEDKLHLNGPGYRAWVEILRPVIETLASAPPKGATT